QVWQEGVTDASGQGAGIEAWFGISPEGTNSDPSTWTTWIAGTYNVDSTNNDEYTANIGSNLLPETYYYASRFRLTGGPYVYGGVGGPWNGTGNNSGVLTVEANPTQCATNHSPVNGTVNVPKGLVAVTWTAPASGPAPTSYDVYAGPSGALTLVGNTTTTS